MLLHWIIYIYTYIARPVSYYCMVECMIVRCCSFLFLGVFKPVGPGLGEKQPVAEHASLVVYDSEQRESGIVQDGQQFV